MVNPNIKKKADDIRNKTYGKEVRESLASGLEAMSSDVVETVGRQTDVEEQFQDVIENTTGKDVISAPEIIAARNGESNLKARIDKDHQEVTSQLANMPVYMNSFGAVPDGETDSTDAFKQAGLSGKTIMLSSGVYVINDTIRLAPYTNFIGNINTTIVMMSNKNVLNLTMYNKIRNIVFDVENVHSFTESVIEVSSKTLEGVVNDTGSSNLQIYVEDCEFHVNHTNSNDVVGTIFHIWAAKTDWDGNEYENRGIWGVNLDKILVKGHIGYVIRTYSYGERGWITTIRATNFNINTAKYGYFDSRSEETMTDPNYVGGDQIFIDSWTFQFFKSKYFAYFSRGNKFVSNSVPYDWGQYNTIIDNTRPFLIKYVEGGHHPKFHFLSEYSHVINRVRLFNAPEELVGKEYEVYLEEQFTVYNNMASNQKNQALINQEIVSYPEPNKILRLNWEGVHRRTSIPHNILHDNTISSSDGGGINYTDTINIRTKDKTFDRYATEFLTVAIRDLTDLAQVHVTTLMVSHTILSTDIEVLKEIQQGSYFKDVQFTMESGSYDLKLSFENNNTNDSFRVFATGIKL